MSRGPLMKQERSNVVFDTKADYQGLIDHDGSLRLDNLADFTIGEGRLSSIRARYCFYGLPYCRYLDGSGLAGYRIAANRK
jgi:hypothetical protein